MKMILLGLIAAIASVGKCCQIILPDDYPDDAPEMGGMAVGACMEVVLMEAGTTTEMSFMATCDGTTPKRNVYTGTGCSGDPTDQGAFDGTCATIDNCVTVHMKMDMDNSTGSACTNPLFLHKFTNYVKLSMSFSNECQEINSTYSGKIVCTGADVQTQIYDGTGCTGAIAKSETTSDIFGSHGGCTVITCGAAEMMVYSVFLVLAAVISFM